MRDGGVNTARILQPDMKSANGDGVVHMIDAVLVPAALKHTVLGMAGPSGSAAEGATADSVDIPTLASSLNDLSTFVSLLRTAGLGDALRADALTVFAPTNDAFAKLPTSLLALWSRPEGRLMLQSALRYHVVPRTLLRSDMRSGAVSSLDGSLLHVVVDGLSVRISESIAAAAQRERVANTAHVTSLDMIATNGVLHIVDSVLVPATLIPTAITI